MLFTNNSLNSEQYSFSHSPNLAIETFSQRDCCREIVRVTDAILDILNSESSCLPITTTETDKNNKPYEVRIRKNSSVFNRDEDDVYRLLFQKPEFEKHLKLLGFKKPDDKESVDYACYLQVCFFMYFMIYFIFPKEKFWDLYDEKNLSSESMLEGSTGNEKYMKFIMDNLSQNLSFKEEQLKRAKVYDAAASDFQSAFFDFYNHHYNVNRLDCTKENIEAFLKNLDLIKEGFTCPVLTENSSRTLFSRFMDNYKYNEMHSTIIDCAENYEKTFEYRDVVLNKTEKTEIPESWWNTLCFKDDIDDVLQDETFIQTVMSCDHLTNTVLNTYKSYDFKSVIEGIWHYEQDQIENCEDDGFEFLQWDEDFCISLADLAIICITFKNLPLSVSYSTNRNLLLNRDDGTKGKKRSIKRSYSAPETDGLDISKSSLRDATFRLLCMIVRKQHTGDLNSYNYFEFPLNRKILEFEQLAEMRKENTLEERIERYQTMSECFLSR